MSFPASPTVGQQVTEGGRLYQWDGYAWTLVSNVSSHASTHASGGSDAVTVAASQVTSGTFSDSLLSANVVLTTDSRLTNARTPTSHAASHASGASDPITPSSIGAAPTADPTFTGVVTVPAGAVGTPSITTTGDTNTGVYFPAADNVAFVTAGAARFRIDSAGGAGLGATPATGRTLLVGRNITGSTTSYGVVQQGAVQSGVTATAGGFLNTVTTQAAAFTLTNYIHFWANQGALGANSAITVQTGFYVDASLINATTNYAYRSAMPAATGRWNAFFDGTAQNYFAGSVGIGSGKSVPTTALDVAGTVTSTGLDVNADTIRVRTAKTPASATAAGNAGEIVWDANYVYVCVSSGNWKRASLASW